MADLAFPFLFPFPFVFQNGYLGKDELMKHLNSEAKFHISEEEAGLLMDHLDEDGNGIIDLNELEVRSVCCLCDSFSLLLWQACFV